MIHSSCSRFLAFLDNHSIVSEKGITPEVIKKFQAQDNHSTVEGKNAYALKIRGFLRFLAREGLVPETLELAVSTEMAPHTSIVTTLSDHQIDAIYTFRQNVDRPIEIRNAAMIMLGPCCHSAGPAFRHERSLQFSLGHFNTSNPWSYGDIFS